MPDSLTNALTFLVSALFDLYLLVLCARFILALSRADYFNPITRVIIQLTQPIVAPLRRIIPNYSRWELSTLIIIFIVEIIKMVLLSFIMVGRAPVSIIIYISFINIIRLFLNTFFYAILLYVILSWFRPGYSPVGQVLEQLSAPILKPCKRVIPPLGGIDLSPVLALIIIQFLLILIQGLA